MQKVLAVGVLTVGCLSIVFAFFYFGYNGIIAPTFGWPKATPVQVVFGWLVMVVVGSFFRSIGGKQ